jgi:hypothetical protein
VADAHRRRLAGIGAGVAITLLVASSSASDIRPRPVDLSRVQEPTVVTIRRPVPLLEDPSPTPSPRPRLSPQPRPRASRTPAPVVSRPVRVYRGWATWGPFSGHVVTRLPRGTRIRVCGAGGCWTGRSWGYGPKRLDRVADLDLTLFPAICGLPLTAGTCRVKLEVLR